MGGVTASKINVSNLKEIITKTTKATKVSRGDEKPKHEDAEQLIDKNMTE